MERGSRLTSSVGIVVPTLGRRPEFLMQCLESIKTAGAARVCLVAPAGFDFQQYFECQLVDQFVEDPGRGLAAAINSGVAALPKEVTFINWLCDDDLLYPSSITVATRVLLGDDEIALVFGSCDYVDSLGTPIWKNKSGQWAVPLLHIGPDLIPQPGGLIRRKFFEEIGGLNSRFSWAFDFDLYLRLKKKGKLKFVRTTLASFRWHPDSLSVGQRRKSVAEASEVRVSHLSPLLRLASPVWELPVKTTTLIAGHLLSYRAGKKPR